MRVKERQEKIDHQSVLKVCSELAAEKECKGWGGTEQRPEVGLKLANSNDDHEDDNMGPLKHPLMCARLTRTTQFLHLRAFSSSLGP